MGRPSAAPGSNGTGDTDKVSEVVDAPKSRQLPNTEPPSMQNYSIAKVDSNGSLVEKFVYKRPISNLAQDSDAKIERMAELPPRLIDDAHLGAAQSSGTSDRSVETMDSVEEAYEASKVSQDKIDFLLQLQHKNPRPPKLSPDWEATIAAVHEGTAEIGQWGPDKIEEYMFCAGGSRALQAVLESEYCTPLFRRNLRCKLESNMLRVIDDDHAHHVATKYAELAVTQPSHIPRHEVEFMDEQLKTCFADLACKPYACRLVFVLVLLEFPNAMAEACTAMSDLSRHQHGCLSVQALVRFGGDNAKASALNLMVAELENSSKDQSRSYIIKLLLEKTSYSFSLLQKLVELGAPAIYRVKNSSHGVHVWRSLKKLAAKKRNRDRLQMDSTILEALNLLSR